MLSSRWACVLCGIVAAVLPLAAADADSSVQDVATQYGVASKRIVSGAIADPNSLDRLEYLCDRIGNRLSGSPALDRAIAWAQGEMKNAGLANVRTQAVKVPHWVRGEESATMIVPLNRKLPMLGLGNSIGTPAEGLTADIVVVTSFDQLDQLKPEQVAGKIVLFDEPYQGYGRTVMYRVTGASRAAARGATAVLVRSITPFSLRTPHTGVQIYSDPNKEIPAAAVTIEDAEAIHRLTDRGQTVRVQLKMSAHFEPDADSANVMGEIVGREKPEEFVDIGGHIDSWDVGQGAQDDGSGIMASLEAVALLKRLGLQPRRTIRLVFWVNEENGGAGGKAYRDMLGDSIRNHVAAIEMDGGAERPLGFGATFAQADLNAPNSKAIERLRAIASLLMSINATQVTAGGGGSDIEPMMGVGVPGIAEISSGAHYFDWHHTEADTFDKVNPQEFRESVAALAVMSYVLADMPGRLDALGARP